ncbi:dihydrofolate reductase [Lapillicoccus jejuensis]|uniref:Dihydrofolate reductase n=2 Tax=Lapillicoccus jejuensis TaxID=402171 RepID=A0A542DYF0_9MICO|nr:dihydrofolate reductase [Lapillicoccus jejuensis]
MSVSVDGFVADRDGDLGWAPPPSDEVFAAHLERVSSLGGYLLGRRLHAAMLPWETDAAMRSTPPYDAFADAWTALPKAVFSRTLTTVDGNARLADRPLEDEIRTVLDATDRPVEIGGADLAGQAVRLGLVDELRIFRVPVVLGGGTPYLPSLESPRSLELVATRAFASGTLEERYRFSR